MQKLLLLTILTILLIFSNNCFSDIKAVQISYVKIKSYKELENEFIKIKKNGYDTIIFRVFHNKGDRFFPFISKINSKYGIYYKSKYVPCVNDCLKDIIKLAHKHKLKLIAWMQTRYLDFFEVPSERKVFKFDFKNKKIEPTKGLSFFNKKNYDFILKIYYDLLKYNIDGILFQDDLKILIDEDFNPYAIKKFYKKTGIYLTPKNINKILFGNSSSRTQIKPTNFFYIWLKIKENQIKKFIEYLTKNIKKQKDIKIFMNVSYEFLLNPHLSIKWFGYNYHTIENCPIDKFVVMLYQEQIKKELNLNDEEYFKVAKKIIKNANLYDKNRFIIKIQTFDWYKNKPIKKRDFENLLTFLKINNIKNLALFPYFKNMF